MLLPVSAFFFNSIQFNSGMRGQSMRYQNILTAQNNSKQEDSIMLLLMSLNEVCLTMPQ